MAGIPGCSIRRSPGSRARRPTATSSTWSPMPASSSPADSTTARAAFACGCTTWDNTQALDDAFWRDRLVDGRRAGEPSCGSTSREGAARLVFSEADGLSGLVVDRYAEWLVVQVTSLGIVAAAGRDRSTCWCELVQPRGIFIRTEKGVAYAEGSGTPRRADSGRSADGPRVHRRERPPLRHRSGRRAEDRASISTSATIAGGRPLPAGPPRARHVLLQRRLQPERRGARQRQRSARRRLQRQGRRAGPGQCRAERRDQRAFRSGRLFRSPRGLCRPTKSSAP